MDDMSYGIDCLLNDDPKSALEQAQTLDLLNQERRAVQDDMQADAQILLDKLSLGDTSKLPFGLCLYDAHWHQGVVGILASKIKEQVHRPVIVFASHPDNPTVAKGSARSVKGVHIRDILANIDAQNPDLISQFGGHAMAAGLSLDLEQLNVFKQAFDAQVRQHLDASALEGQLLSDGVLDGVDFNLDFADSLRTLTPWGQHFPEPLFNGRFQILEKKVLKEKHLKMLVKPENGNLPVDVIAFFTTDEGWATDTEWVNLAYRLDINQFRGLKSLQLMAEYVEPIFDNK
jgi:single-stranded-DNA-specific exonuclease